MGLAVFFWKLDRSWEDLRFVRSRGIKFGMLGEIPGHDCDLECFMNNLDAYIVADSCMACFLDSF